MKKFSLLFFLFFALSISSYTQNDKILDTLKYLMQIDSQINEEFRYTRSFLDHRDSFVLNEIIDLSNKITEREIEFANKMNLFLQSKDINFSIIYHTLNKILEVNKSDILLSLLLSRADEKVITDTDFITGSLPNPYLLNHPIAAVIVKNHSIFVDFLLCSDYLRKKRELKELLLIPALLGKDYIKILNDSNCTKIHPENLNIPLSNF